MGKINVVLAGKYENEDVGGTSVLSVGSRPLSKSSLSAYTVINETTKEGYSVAKGLMGKRLFGEYGWLAGVGGKTRKEYLISIEWKEGDKSLICIDDDHYKTFLKWMF